MRTVRRVDVAVGLMLLSAASVALYSGVELAARYFASRDSPELIERLGKVATRLSPLNWRYTYRYGTLLKMLGRSDEAAEAFRQALEQNPSCAMCSVGLAEVEGHRGGDAVPWLRQATEHGRSDTKVRMSTGIVYAQLGMRDEAAEEFGAALLGSREHHYSLFDLFHRVYSADFVLDRIVPDAVLDRYLTFVERSMPPDVVAAVWNRYRATEVSDTARRDYVDYLLQHGLVEQAWDVQFGTTPLVDAPLLDGAFEAVGEQGRFGWQIRDDEGVRADIRACTDCADRGRALRIRFDGEHNPNYFGVLQYVPVLAGARYALTARMRAEDITSARGPWISVAGVPGREGEETAACRFWEKSEEMRDTTPWQDVYFEFSVPAPCRGVRVYVSRPATQRLNKFIAGALWVDDVRLELLTGPSEQPAEPSTTPPAWFLRGLKGASIDAVERRVDELPSENALGPVTDETLRVGADELDGAGQISTDAWRALVDRMAVAGHGVEQPSAEQLFGAPLGALAPDSEQRVAVELQQCAHRNPVAHQERAVLKDLVALGVGDYRRYPTCTKAEDRLGNGWWDDGNRHFDQDARRSSEQG